MCIRDRCKLLFRYRVDNRDKLRAFQGAEGALVICNHTSFFDVVFMYLAARPKQWVRLMGRDSLFDNAHGLLGQALSRVGAFPVKRDTADMTSIKRAVRMLKRQELVGILPCLLYTSPQPPATLRHMPLRIRAESMNQPDYMKFRPEHEQKDECDQRQQQEEFPNPMTPVSYTHLDVYNRQMPDS